MYQRFINSKASHRGDSASGGWKHFFVCCFPRLVFRSARILAPKRGRRSPRRPRGKHLERRSFLIIHRFWLHNRPLTQSKVAKPRQLPPPQRSPGRIIRRRHVSRVHTEILLGAASASLHLQSPVFDELPPPRFAPVRMDAPFAPIREGGKCSRCLSCHVFPSFFFFREVLVRLFNARTGLFSQIPIQLLVGLYDVCVCVTMCDTFPGSSDGNMRGVKENPTKKKKSSVFWFHCVTMLVNVVNRTRKTDF